jgi:hypothetical protein
VTSWRLRVSIVDVDITIRRNSSKCTQFVAA